MQILGIDIGGTGIKGAPVDTETGTLIVSRQRIPTPAPAKRKAVARRVKELTDSFGWKGMIGCGFPAAIRYGMALTAANIPTSWIGTDVAGLFSAETGCPVHVINDADAAGLAEMTFGAGRGCRGVTLLVTIGTGLGTVLFVDGNLVPNTELGHIEINCKDAEIMASDAARKRDKLSWSKWARRLDHYLVTLERLVWPDLIILGGGAVKQADKYLPLLTVKARVASAQLGNDAGIVGAALAARNALAEADEQA
jgi:polyphosphate glucokinase